MKKLSQRGFTIVEVSLVVVIVILVGGIGYYAYRQTQNNKSVSQDQTTSDKEQPAAEPVVDETANWLVYESKDKSYSFKVPDGWTLHSFMNEGPPYTENISELMYRQGTKAQVQQTSDAGDIYVTAFGINYYATSDGSAPKGALQGSFKTDNGDVVNKYVYTYTGNEEFDAHEAGTTRYDYRITKGDKTFSVAHDIKSGEQEVTGIVEKAIRTLKLN